MPAYFLDTSALAKRYIQEVGSAWIVDICDNAGDDLIFISEITEIEMLAAVRRRFKRKTISENSASVAVADFDADLTSQYISLKLTRDVLNLARNVVERNALRAYDAVQLATALECNRQQAELDLPQIKFISADNELLNAALSEGLQTDNPNNHP